MVRSWDAVKAVLSLGIMRLRQGKRTGDLEIQKLKNQIDESSVATEKLLEKDQVLGERDEEIDFLLKEIENIKISLEDTYRTIDGLEGNIFWGQIWV